MLNEALKQLGNPHNRSLPDVINELENKPELSVDDVARLLITDYISLAQERLPEQESSLQEMADVIIAWDQNNRIPALYFLKKMSQDLFDAGLEECALYSRCSDTLVYQESLLPQKPPDEYKEAMEYITSKPFSYAREAALFGMMLNAGIHYPDDSTTAILDEYQRLYPFMSRVLIEPDTRDYFELMGILEKKKVIKIQQAQQLLLLTVRMVIREDPQTYQEFMQYSQDPNRSKDVEVDPKFEKIMSFSSIAMQWKLNNEPRPALDFVLDQIEADSANKHLCIKMAKAIIKAYGLKKSTETEDLIRMERFRTLA